MLTSKPTPLVNAGFGSAYLYTDPDPAGYADPCRSGSDIIEVIGN